MSPDLQQALIGLVAALTAWVWAEVRYRQARRRTDDNARRIVDVQQKVGADRRQTDRREHEH